MRKVYKHQKSLKMNNFEKFNFILLIYLIDFGDWSVISIKYLGSPLVLKPQTIEKESKFIECQIEEDGEKINCIKENEEVYMPFFSKFKIGKYKYNIFDYFHMFF